MPVLTLSETNYAGFTVLESSKCLIYDFHYSFIKKMMVNRYFLTQTASLMKSSQYMFMKNSLNTNICLTLAIFQKVLTFMILKMKMNIEEFR